MANIFLSCPIISKPELIMMSSLYSAILKSKNHRIRLYFSTQDSLISRVRNVHISAFYYEYPECEWFVSIDSDLEIVNCLPDNNIFDKLTAHGLEFVGGLYAIKKQGVAQCSSIPVDVTKKIEYNTGLVEMRWLSTGCWCVHRSAVEKLIKAYPELLYSGDDTASGKTVFGWYIPMICDLQPGEFPTVTKVFRKYLSEDWSASKRWRDIGGKIFADTSIVLNHIGKYSYSLWPVEKREKPSLPEPGFDLEDKNIK